MVATAYSGCPYEVVATVERSASVSGSGAFSPTIAVPKRARYVGIQESNRNR